MKENKQEKYHRDVIEIMIVEKRNGKESGFKMKR